MSSVRERGTLEVLGTLNGIDGLTDLSIIHESFIDTINLKFMH